MNQAEQDEQDQANLKNLQAAGYAFGSVADMKDWLAEFDLAPWHRSWFEDELIVREHHTLPPAGDKGDW